jgi:hypothetical protein
MMGHLHVEMDAKVDFDGHVPPQPLDSWLALSVDGMPDAGCWSRSTNKVAL